MLDPPLAKISAFFTSEIVVSLHAIYTSGMYAGVCRENVV